MPSSPGGRPWLSTSRQYSPRPMASCSMPAAMHWRTEQTLIRPLGDTIWIHCMLLNPILAFQGGSTFMLPNHPFHSTLRTHTCTVHGQWSSVCGGCLGKQGLSGRTLGCEVEGSGGAPGPVTPVDSALPVRILVVVEHAICVLTGVPVLPKCQLWHRCIQVLLHKLAACAHFRERLVAS